MYGDCLDRMKEIPDNSIDLVVTSPPYDNLRTYNNSLNWNFEIFCNVADELKRVTEGQIPLPTQHNLCPILRITLCI